MNIFSKIRSIFSDNTTAVAEYPLTTSALPGVLRQQDTAEVILFPSRAGTAGQRSFDTSLSYNPVPVPARFLGVMDLEGVRKFLENNWFCHGRHTGAHMKSVEALERDKKVIISGFRNSMEALIERRREKKKRIQYEEVLVRGASEVVEKQLRLCLEHLESEINLLQSQVALASEGAGWVKAAIDQYECGFLRGLQDALSFELLSSR